MHRRPAKLLQHFKKMIDKWARLLDILQSIKPGGREYHLITLRGLREAGERHHDLNGGDVCEGGWAQQGDGGEVL